MNPVMKIEQAPQSQESLVKQLDDLWCAANRLGLNDAADYLAKLLRDKRDSL